MKEKKSRTLPSTAVCCMFNKTSSKILVGGTVDARVRSGVKAALLWDKTKAWTGHGNKLESQSKNNLK